MELNSVDIQRSRTNSFVRKGYANEFDQQEEKMLILYSRLHAKGLFPSIGRCLLTQEFYENPVALIFLKVCTPSLDVSIIQRK